MTMLKFWELAPSPNNTKVRMALRFKGLDFETLPVDPADRRPLIDVSGQAMTPCIEDRGIVLNDSEAILQYLDANYRDTPRLMPADRDGRRTCDAWKQTLDARAASQWLPVFLYAIRRREDLDTSARDRFADYLAELDGTLADGRKFGDVPCAVNDLRVAEWATYALPGPGLLSRVPLFKKFQELYGIEAGSLRHLEAFLEPWNERLA